MDYVLRCSIIFITFYVMFSNFGVDATNPIIRTKFDKVNTLQNQLNEPNENALPWQQLRNSPFKFLRNLDNYDFNDYSRGGDALERSSQYSSENTQSVANDDYYQDAEDQSLSSDEISYPRHVEKRGRHHLDLCPLYEKKYKLKREWRESGVWELNFNYTEKVCNHTTTSRNYDSQRNRICDAIGKTFEHGRGTHCFQRFASNHIEIKNTQTGIKIRYTEENFRDGCSCGWAINELGSITEYHEGKILNLCKDIRKML